MSEPSELREMARECARAIAAELHSMYEVLAFDQHEDGRTVPPEECAADMVEYVLAKLARVQSETARACAEECATYRDEARPISAFHMLGAADCEEAIRARFPAAFSMEE